MPQDNGSCLLKMAKRYSGIKYSLSILQTLYLVALLFIFVGLGLSETLAQQLAKISSNNYLTLALYLLTTALLYYLVSLPLNFYRSYILEHKFSLSSQSIADWLRDQFKSAALSYLIGLIVLGAFYYILKVSPHHWWAVLSLFWILFSLILTRLTPVIIIPLFFKYRKLSDQSLRQRILHLAEKMKVRVLDVFEIDFSKKTLKANAGFVGMGNTRRVILADTLKDKYSPEEIEVILAHEFAHYKLKHLLKLILLNSLVSIVCFYLIFKTSVYALNFFGFSSLSEIAALPVVIIYFVLFGIVTQPLSNALSRKLEKNADLLALKITGSSGAFVSMMDKLAQQNLADRNPHPLIKFFFFDHPPIDERIALANRVSI
ncbi:MAG: M48 family metallopeptidase [Candidatus Omnitrophota bacterium]|nr:M48 family metallopeptidase [Candidatus Omnitrophota bacterium]